MREKSNEALSSCEATLRRAHDWQGRPLMAGFARWVCAQALLLPNGPVIDCEPVPNNGHGATSGPLNDAYGEEADSLFDAFRSCPRFAPPEERTKEQVGSLMKGRMTDAGLRALASTLSDPALPGKKARAHLSRNPERGREILDELLAQGMICLDTWQSLLPSHSSGNVHSQ